MNRQRSTQALIIAIVAALLLAILGYVVWQNVSGQQEESTVETSSSTSETNNDADEEEEVQAEEGVISGSLTYPSEGIPENLEIHAYNIDTKEDFYVKDHLKGDEYQYGVGFEMTVPAGRYHVYGVLAPDVEKKAYYNEFVECGMSVECTDTSTIEVVVEAGEKTEGVIVGDWYNI